MKKRCLMLSVIALGLLSGCNGEKDKEVIVPELNGMKQLIKEQEKEELNLAHIMENKNDPVIVDEILKRNSKDAVMYASVVERWHSWNKVSLSIEEFLYMVEELIESKKNTKSVNYVDVQNAEKVLKGLEELKVMQKKQEDNIGSIKDLLEKTSRLEKNKELSIVLYSGEQIEKINESLLIMESFYETKVEVKNGKFWGDMGINIKETKRQLERIRVLNKEVDDSINKEILRQISEMK